MKSYEKEKQTQIKHTEELRRRITDLERCKSDILHQKASSVEVIDALQLRLDHYEKCKNTETYAMKASNNVAPKNNKKPACTQKTMDDNSHSNM